mmetsp:Transcript_29132/g.71545  ORF Transcript_29132/g.71545 Transcript_29132/m.71545 type:complete len:120 (+) Transcript_29132:1810-2169(+)
MVETTVRASAASLVSVCTISLAMYESRPDVGSSRKRIDGRWMSASAMLTRFACPPEMPRISTFPITVLRHVSSPSVPMTSSTRARRCSEVHVIGSVSSAVYISICVTVSSPMSVSNCST